MIFRDLRYILKKVIIGIAIIIGVLFFKTKLGFALTYSVDSLLIDNWELTVGNWYERGQDVGFKFTLIGVADTDQDTNLYGQILLCAGPSNNSIAWAQTSDAQSWNLISKNTLVNNTNVYCKVGNVSGKVQQLLFTTRAVYGDITANVRMSYKDGYTGFSIVSYGFKDSPWDLIQSEFDYTNQLTAMSTLIDNKWNQEINKLADIWGVNQQQLAEAQAEVTDNDTDAMQEWLEDFTSDTYGLTGIITAPLNTITSLTSKTCSPLVLPIPYLNENLTLPCMSTIYSDTFGSAFTMYQTITTALIGYWCVVRIFAIVKGMKDPQDDKIEVVDL